MSLGCSPQAARAWRSSSADREAAQALAAKIGEGSLAAADNRDAVRGTDAVVLALRFGALKGVIDEVADLLAHKLLVVPSNPVSVDTRGNISRVLPRGQSSGAVIRGWLPAEARLAMAFGTLSSNILERCSTQTPPRAVLFYATDSDLAGHDVERLIRTAGFDPVRLGGLEQSSRLEVGGDLHDLVVGSSQARSLIAAP